MNAEEARSLLPKYAEGALPPPQAEAVEALLAENPQLEAELSLIKEENELLAQALAPLRPNRSARIRLSDAMHDVYRQAEEVANWWPQRAWSFFRLVVGYVSFVTAVWLGFKYPPPSGPGLTLAAIVTYGFGLAFLVSGRDLVRLEAQVVSFIARREVKSSRLEALLLEVFGFFVIIAAAAMYVYNIW